MTALVVLLLAGGLCGLAVAWSFGRFGDPAAAKSAINRALAHVMEFRLFIDEPALVLRAQRDLLRANFEILRILLRPSLVMLIPLALVTVTLDALFSRAPLRLNAPAVLTLPYREGDAVSVRTPPGIALETAGVRSPGVHQISFRLRPLRETSGTIAITRGTQAMRRHIAAGSGWAVNWPFGETAELDYPKALIFGWPWWIWYGLAFTVSAPLARIALK